MKLTFISIIFLLPIFALSQIKAITENGDEVVLYDSGKWKFVNENSKLEEELLLNPIEFNKSDKQTFAVKSNVNNTIININPKEWTFKKSEMNAAAEYDFESKDGSFYGMLITEKIGIPKDQLTKIAFENALKAAPDMELISQEKRIVNGQEVIAMKMRGTISGIDLGYFSYYFSNNSGSTQLITFTGYEIMESEIKKAEDFLNGFIILNQ